MYQLDLVLNKKFYEKRLYLPSSFKNLIPTLGTQSIPIYVKVDELVGTTLFSLISLEERLHFYLIILRKYSLVLYNYYSIFDLNYYY